MFMLLFLFLLSMPEILGIACLNYNGMRDMNKFKQVVNGLNSQVICLQETNWTDDLMNGIKKVWEGDLYVNHGTQRACGVAILVRGGELDNIKQIHNDGKGRILGIDFKYQNDMYRLVNVYAPNVETARKEAFMSLKTLCTGKCIVVGDFNVKCTRLDISKSMVFKDDTSRKCLNMMMQSMDMADAWREENPYKREFSRRQMVMGVLKQSRIDLCLVKREILQYIKNVNYKFTGISDHAIMTVKLGVFAKDKGGGTWCLNSALLKEDAYKSCIDKCIKYEMENPLYEEDVCEWWERLKERVKKISIGYSKQRNHKRTCKVDTMFKLLEIEVEKMENNPGYTKELYCQIKAEIEEYENEKCKGAIVRSRAQYVLEGERCTKYFMNLEKKKQGKKFITELDNGEGGKVTDYVEIIERVEAFYKNLFKTENIKQEYVDKVLDAVSIGLTEEDRNMCDGDISLEEIEEAIIQAKPNKSPGSDGLTHEFYKTFLKILAPVLLKLFRSMEEKKEVPKSMCLGVIMILFKNKGSSLKLENYRPLSLLNTEYKILTKILANRLKRVIGSIIAPNQAYSIPGRDITDTICTIRDVVGSMGNDQEGGVVLCVDLNKAFDRVEHHYMEQTMRKFGFGDRILKWISLLYSNAESCVKVNGVLTDPFPLERSVRQGCPMSALLYSISVEPLAIMVRADKKIRGIQIPHSGVSVIHQYADDTTFTTKDVGSIKRIMRHIDVFGKASGAKINIEKSEIMRIGGVDMSGCDIPFKITKEYVNILGVNIGVNAKEARDVTWTGILSKIKQVLQFWKLR